MLLLVMGFGPWARTAAIELATNQTLPQPVCARAPEGNAGLFVGINEFTHDAGLRALHFAVDDAVAQAHLFVQELRLIPARQCWLALGGSSTNQLTRRQLAELEAKGVQRVDGQKTAVLQALIRAINAPNAASNLLVVSFSSHGFEEDGDAYVMPSDGLRGALEDTGLRLRNIETRLDKSQAGKRLLLVDACRDQPLQQAKGGAEGMTRRFLDALAMAEGQAVLASCDAGQVSLERADMGHGVFTYYLIEALRGGAKANAQGFITLGAVANYVAREVQTWGRLHGPADLSLIQRPWFKGPKLAESIPLAADPVVNQALVQVINTLLTRVGPPGTAAGLTAERCQRLVQALQEPTNDELAASLLAQCRTFVAGNVSPEEFGVYLDQTLPLVRPVAAALATNAIASVVAYLRSTAEAISGRTSYQEFANRFEHVSKSEVRDRMLNKTWIILRDIKTWDEAKSEAGQQSARLPKLAELKTLLTLEAQNWDGPQEVYLNTSFFPKMPRTMRCWTSDWGGISQRKYVDFGSRLVGETSRSERLAVFLVRD